MSEEQKPLVIDLRLGLAVCEIAQRACISEGERLTVEDLTAQLQQEQERVAIARWQEWQGAEVAAGKTEEREEPAESEAAT